MGDVRFHDAYLRLAEAVDLRAAAAMLRDDELVQALAATSSKPYFANVVASALLNRLRLKNTILVSAGEGLCAVDSAGRISFMNPAAEQMLGCSLASVAGSRFHELVHDHAESVPARRLCPLELVARTGASIRVEHGLFSRSDGTPVPVAYTVTPIRRGEETDGLVVTFRDNAQLVSVLRSIERDESRLTEAMALAELGRWDWTAGEEALWLSEPLGMLLGLDGEDSFSFAELQRLIDPGDAERLEREVKRAFATRSCLRIEHGVILGDGRRRRFRTQGVVRAGPDGAPGGMWGISMDVTAWDGARAMPAAATGAPGAADGRSAPRRPV